MTEEKLKLVEEVCRMLSERSEYHISQWETCHENMHLSAGMAYSTARTMLQYALEEDRESLKQYDYYDRGM